MNLSILDALKSKTIWAAIGLVVINGLNAAAQNPASTVHALQLTGNQADIANLVLGAVAIWGRMRPKQGVTK